MVTKVLAFTALGIFCCLSLPSNLHSQSTGDVAQQIKQLQQESRDAQMKNDVSWEQKHLAQGFMGGNGSVPKPEPGCFFGNILLISDC